MIPGGVTEVIGRFAGYLHLITDVVLPRLHYEDPAETNATRDYRPRLESSAVSIDELEETGSSTTPFTRLTGAVTSVPAFQVDLPDITGISDIRPMRFNPILEAKAFVPIMPASGGGGGQTTNIQTGFTHPPAQYTIGGDDKIIDVGQDSWLRDNDRLVDEDIDWPADDLARLKEMIGEAQDAVPQDLRLPAGDATDIAETLIARDQDRAQSEEPHPDNVAPGRYINDELQEAPLELGTWADRDAEPEAGPEAKTASASIDGTWPVGQEAQTGANEQTNAAQIIDSNEASAGIIVLGDYYETNAIVQINVYQDLDRTEITNGAGIRTDGELLSVTLDEGSATNDAEFQQDELTLNIVQRGIGPVQWNVEIVHGDYLDIKSLRQTNVLIDNDVVTQTSTDIYAYASSGGNEQSNAARFLDMAKSYDLIVVLGDMHEGNFIFQTNILLDDDLARLSADGWSGEIGSAVQQSVRMGESDLLNEALIRNIGSFDFVGVTPDIEAPVAAMGKLSESLDPTLAWQMLGGSGVIDVLYVTGNYYDYNIISQVNIMSDMDMAIQVAGAGTIGVDAVTQDVETGGNSLINSAAIVDVGTVTDIQYLGGEHYSDTLLVQANIVTEDETISYGDPAALATELVAFVTDASSDSDGPDPLLAAPAQAGQGDFMGSVLT